MILGLAISFIDACAANDRSRAAEAWKSRLPLEAPRSLAMQTSMGVRFRRMNTALARLLQWSTAHPEAIGWASSVTAHALGALAFWGSLVPAAPDVLPRLPGQITRVQLVATMVEPVRRTEGQVAPFQTRVVITPDWAEIDRRRFTQTSTHITRPTADELAFVDRIMAPSPPTTMRAERPRSEPEMSEFSQLQVAGPRRRLKPVEIPEVRAEMPSSTAERPLVGTSGESLPQLRDNRPPLYPAQAVVDRLEGTVILRIHITAEGDVADVTVYRSSDRAILDAEAVRAVRQWRFDPARRGGRPVPATVRLPVRFSLDD